MKILRFAALITWLALPRSLAAQTLAEEVAPSFGRVARLSRLHAHSKRYEAEAVYPTFRLRTPLLRFAGAQMRRQTRADFADFLRQAREDLKGSPQSPPFEFQTSPSLMLYRPTKIVSLRWENYGYYGGAHGLGFSSTDNFGIVAGRPRRLSLGDLFGAGTPYRALVEKKILAKLRRDPNAEWVKNGDVKSLATEQFNNFFVGKKGLTWIFNPYEMGPYASGQFEITLSIGELGPDFRRSWLL